MTQRTQFIGSFFRKHARRRYALLKHIWPAVAELPESSDLDILVREKDIPEYIQSIREDQTVRHVHVHNKSFVCFCSVLFYDGSYLELDLIHRFDRKGTVYLNANEVLRNSVITQEGISICSEKHTFEYVILFHLLNHSSVPQKYREYFADLGFEKRSEIFGHMCEKYNLHINQLDDLYQHSSRHVHKLKEKIRSVAYNKGIKKIGHRLNYFMDVVRDAFKSRGTVITFSGVDGAGKTTVLEEISRTLREKYRQKVIVLRHRPSVLPILSVIKYGKSGAHARVNASLPRQGKNENRLSSLMRFGYYYTDYLLGQFYIWFKYTLRGYTVVYDRYYFDFIIDSRRSNIRLSKGFVKWCYHFVFKPQVNVFLYASADIIRSRKQEMNSDEITELTTEYKTLFEDFGRTYRNQQYMIINNTNLNETLDKVMDQCITAVF